MIFNDIAKEPTSRSSSSISAMSCAIPGGRQEHGFG